MVACGCPTGSGESTIQAVGVFSPSAGTSAAIAKILETQGWSETCHRNYGPREPGGEPDCGQGLLEEFGSWEEVVARWPGAVALRVAVLTEERDANVGPD